MSVQAITWAFEQGDMSSGQKLLLVAIANHADKFGVGYPGRKSLAVDCSCTPQTVSENMAKLEEGRLIARCQRRRKNGSRTSDWIVLAPQWASRGALHDAPEEDFPPQVAELASGRETGPESGRDFRGGQVGFSGSPEPSEEPRSSPDGEDVALLPSASDEVFEFWKITFGLNGNTAFSAKRKKKVRERLSERDITVERVKRAILGCAGSDFHVKGNHIDLAHICSDRETFERFERMPPRGVEQPGKYEGLTSN